MPSLGFLSREVFIETQTGGGQRRLQPFYSSTQFIAACAGDNTSYSPNTEFLLANNNVKIKTNFIRGGLIFYQTLKVCQNH